MYPILLSLRPHHRHCCVWYFTFTGKLSPPEFNETYHSCPFYKDSIKASFVVNTFSLGNSISVLVVVLVILYNVTLWSITTSLAAPVSTYRATPFSLMPTTMPCSTASSSGVFGIDYPYVCILYLYALRTHNLAYSHKVQILR